MLSSKLIFKKLLNSKLLMAFSILLVSVLVVGVFFVSIVSHATPISQCKLKIEDDNCLYTGSRVVPKITISDGDTKLKEGRDYRVSYKGNVRPGTAKVVIAGRGQYRGFVKRDYQISIDPVKNLNAKYKDEDSEKNDSFISLAWLESKACDYYSVNVDIKGYDKKDIQKLHYETNQNNYILKDLKDKGVYTFTVTAVVGSKKHQSPSETVSVYVKPLDRPTITSATSPGAGRIDISWDKVPNAQSYIVKEVSESNGDVEEVTVDGGVTATTFMGTIKGNNYTYTVTAKATLNDNEYTSEESESKTVSSATPRIGEASNGEGGSLTGCRAGDQSGNECSVGKWSYSSSSGNHNHWAYVARFKDSEKAAKAAEAMVMACANNHIGYDQRPDSGRGELKSLAAAADWNMSAITTDCETSCSPLVGACISCAGIDFPVPGSTDDSDMLHPLERTGEFEILTDSKYTSSDMYLQQGDILVSPGIHTCMVI